LINWISHSYGFGTYIHLIEDYYSKATYQESRVLLKKLISNHRGVGNHVFIDTMISPSYTSAIAQTIQLPGISGMENNMLILEYDRDDPDNLGSIIDNFALVNAGKFDVCILGSSNRPLNFKNGIHVWLRSLDQDNAHLMILLSFIIQGHPAWKKSNISIFQLCKPGTTIQTRRDLESLISTGRLPITTKNIEIIEEDQNRNYIEIVDEKSDQAALTILGFTGESLKIGGKNVFEQHKKEGHILFVSAAERKEIQ